VNSPAAAFAAAASNSAMTILRASSIRVAEQLIQPVGDDLPAQAEAVRYARTAVMFISIVPWHAPLKISVCMVPESDPSGWGV
jgi:hypothetical protein